MDFYTRARAVGGAAKMSNKRMSKLLLQSEILLHILKIALIMRIMLL